MNYFGTNDKSFYIYKSDEVSYLNQSKGATCFYNSVQSFNSNSVQSNIELYLRVFHKEIEEYKFISHLSLLSKDEVKYWFSILNKVVPFSYKLYDLDDNSWMIEIKIEKIKKLQYLWLITGIRNIYENFNALIIRDVFDLKYNGLIIHDNLINVFNVLFSVTNWYSTQTWSSNSWLALLPSLSELHNKLKLHDKDIFEFNISNVDNLKTKNRDTIFGEDNQNSPKNAEKIKDRYLNFYLPKIKEYKIHNLLPDDFIFYEE